MAENRTRRTRNITKLTHLKLKVMTGMLCAVYIAPARETCNAQKKNWSSTQRSCCGLYIRVSRLFIVESQKKQHQFLVCSCMESQKKHVQFRNKKRIASKLKRSCIALANFEQIEFAIYCVANAILIFVRQACNDSPDQAAVYHTFLQDSCYQVYNSSHVKSKQIM